MLAGLTRTYGWLDLVGVLVGFAPLLVAGYAMIDTDFGSGRLRDVLPRKLFAVGAAFLLLAVAAPFAMALNCGTPKRNLTLLAFVNAVFPGASVFLAFAQRRFKMVSGSGEQPLSVPAGPHEKTNGDHDTDAVDGEEPVEIHEHTDQSGGRDDDGES